MQEEEQKNMKKEHRARKSIANINEEKQRKGENIMGSRNKGITLIALVVTIVILIILATVSISALFGENGLIKKAQEARDHQSNAITMEEEDLNRLTAEFTNVMEGGSGVPEPPADTTGPTVNITVGTVTDTSIQIQVTATDESGLAESETYRFLLNEEEKGKNTTGGYTFSGLTPETKYTIRVEVKDKLGNVGEATRDVTTNEPEMISPGTNYVGYYANLDEDPEPEGVIYADQAIGNTGSGQWGDSNGTYSIPVISSGLKSYYVSAKGYSGPFGTKDVLTAVEGSGTADRFYVMALSDIDSSTHYWYDNAYGEMDDYATTTSGDFGAGKTNTANMMTKWTGSGYGTPNDNDMWGLIQNQVAQGWFVPSKEEWSAFGGELGIDKSNYLKFRLDVYYWSSSQVNPNSAWVAIFSGSYMLDSNVYNGDCCVRLSATF